MRKYGHFQWSVNLLTLMGLFHFICFVMRLLTISYFQKKKKKKKKKKGLAKSVVGLKVFQMFNQPK